MPSDFFFKTATNWNDKTGGGGCLATGAQAGEDCRGPWYLFHRVSSEHHASPHVTICERHLHDLYEDRHFVETLPAEDELPARQAAKVVPIAPA